MLKPLFTEDDLRGMASTYSSRLLMANPPKVFEDMFEAIRQERQKQAKIFGNYDPVLTGSRADWAEWAKAVAYTVGCSHLGSEIKDLFVGIERDAVDEMLREKTTKAPEGVPTGYLLRAISAEGLNLGYYTFAASDRHYWLPPEEAVKEKPSLASAVDDKVIQEALDAKRVELFDSMMKGQP